MINNTFFSNINIIFYKMDDYSDIIPDENIQIATPKKCVFLLNKRNMFIKSEKKSNEYNEFIKKNNKEREKENNSSAESDNLKTIIKEPAILTSNIISDLQKLKNNNYNNKKNMTKHLQKINNNLKISLYKKASKDNIYNKKCNSNNKNDNHLNKDKKSKKKKINKIRNNAKNNIDYNNNIFRTKKIINLGRKFQKELSNNINKKSNESKNLNYNLTNKNQNSNTYADTNNKKIFVKKLSQEYKNKTMRNSLSINKKVIKDKQGIITKKISINPKLLKDKKNEELKNEIYITQKDFISDISDKKPLNKNNFEEENKVNILNNSENNKRIHISKSNKNLLEENNKYKSKIFHIDYFRNIKKDLTKTNIGINIIKEICYKKLKINFLKLKKICIYKRKIINNIKMTPKKNIYCNSTIKKTSDNNLSMNNENKNIYKNIINPHIYNSGEYQTVSKYDSFYQKRKNTINNEFNKLIVNNSKTNNINKNKKNRVLFFNTNCYNNNCDFNSIQINLFNNKCMNNKNQILIKNISNNNKMSSEDNINLIKICKTSFDKNV